MSFKSTTLHLIYLLSFIFYLKQGSTQSVKLSNVFVDSSLLKSEVLINASKQNIQSFYLFSHGREGELLIHGAWRNPQQIATFISQQLIANSQQPTSINIYGCNFAKGKKGKQAVAYLEKTLGIAIAASTNITGKDGDWVLEYGDIRDFQVVYNHNLQDTDNDGISDSEDIDDDNDGILDFEEKVSCNLVNDPDLEFPSDSSQTGPDAFFNAWALSPFWFGVSASPGYFNTKSPFPYPAINSPLAPFAGDAYAGFHSGGAFAQEVIGNNLVNDIDSGSGYTFGFYSYRMQPVNGNFQDNGRFYLYGIQSDSSIAGLNTSNLNTLSAHPNVDLLGISDTVSSTTQWNLFNIDFEATHDYDRIMLAIERVASTSSENAFSTPIRSSRSSQLSRRRSLYSIDMISPLFSINWHMSANLRAPN